MTVLWIIISNFRSFRHFNCQKKSHWLQHVIIPETVKSREMYSISSVSQQKIHTDRDTNNANFINNTYFLSAKMRWTHLLLLLLLVRAVSSLSSSRHVETVPPRSKCMYNAIFGTHDISEGSWLIFRKSKLSLFWLLNSCVHEFWSQKLIETLCESLLLSNALYVLPFFTFTYIVFF